MAYSGRSKTRASYRTIVVGCVSGRDSHIQFVFRQAWVTLVPHTLESFVSVNPPPGQTIEVQRQGMQGRGRQEVQRLMTGLRTGDQASSGRQTHCLKYMCSPCRDCSGRCFPYTCSSTTAVPRAGCPGIDCLGSKTCRTSPVICVTPRTQVDGIWGPQGVSALHSNP